MSLKGIGEIAATVSVIGINIDRHGSRYRLLKALSRMMGNYYVRVAGVPTP